ncbi:MAG: ATP-binding protein [Jaaginema sp. PMC 1079.18]|nr:ATP-binding protein [Jaaginema sp. PMC 1080.18]MEC4853751.1 ATP-binding protein [Jaaginema sp. PMC 1079.18]MEC4869075.1 ATP-binding protein [Jaaginema sp. PMC 1078.18]
MDIKSHQFITFFDSESAAQLAAIATVEKFSNQTVIFEEGEVPDYLYLVLVGQVNFRKRIRKHHYQIVATAQPNEFFGEFGVLDGQPRSAQAIVCENATVAKIPRSVLMEILENASSEVVLKLFNYVIQRLRVTTKEYVQQVAYKEKMVLVGEMVNTIIHDLKSPLSGIHLSSGMIKEIHEDEETAEWCELIQQQAQRMTSMAEELLEFAKGLPVLKRDRLNLKPALQQFQKLNGVYCDNARVQLIIKCPEDVTIYADETKLMRVWQNLVVNAVEAFGSKGGIIKIEVTPRPEWVQMTIADDGPGIPEEIRETFFESFVTHGKANGTGLGTAIAKSIVDAHGGTLFFQANTDKGTTFFLNLPYTLEALNVTHLPRKVATPVLSPSRSL